LRFSCRFQLERTLLTTTSSDLESIVFVLIEPPKKLRSPRASKAFATLSDDVRP
jgi:hypothetical protein